MAVLSRVAIIGAGNMGSGIAQKCAQEGLEVVLVDLDDGAVQRGLAGIQALLNKGVERGVLKPDKVGAILSRIHGTSDLAQCANCQLVIEAVFEDLSVKQKLFSQLNDIVPPDCVLATNTSSFAVAEMAAGLSHPERVVGLHFFYHPAMNRLLEIIPHAGTSEAALALCKSFAEKSAKTDITVADAPGFAVNRFFVPWLNEAARILGEGLADIPTIDAAAKKAFKIGMGPFELMNVTGIPISMHSTETLGAKLSAFYGPTAKLTAQYQGKKNWNLEGAPDESRFDAVAGRLLGVVFLVCAQMLDEKVATPGDIDLGAKVGLRWAKGPFELAAKMGIDKVADMVRAIVDAHTDLDLPESLKARVEIGKAWPVSYVELAKDGEFAYITFNRPEAMNALNPLVVGQLAQAWGQVKNDPAIKTVVLSGKGKAFVAGADIGFFLKQMKAGDYQVITDFAANSQNVFNEWAQSDKWVVAKMDGLALGGGAELALACDTIVATPKASMGFPETGIGIYPGLGGTQRSLKFTGLALARWLTFTGQVLGASQAQAAGLIEYLVPVGEAEAKIRELAGNNPKTKAAANPAAAPESLADIAALFGDQAKVNALLAGQAPPESGELGAKMAKVIAQKAPLAVAKCEQLLTEGDKLDLYEGLKLELAAMNQAFATADAMEGLSALVERRRPEFKGA